MTGVEQAKSLLAEWHARERKLAVGVGGADELGPGDLPGVAAAKQVSEAGVDDTLDLVTATTLFQQQRVRAALEACNDSKTAAAQRLGVTRQWLHRLVARWDREGPW